MSYVIRNYGNSRELPYKNTHIFMARDQAIETDDAEMMQALSGQPMISITKQPGTSVPVPAPASPLDLEEPDDEPDDDDNEDDDNDDQGEDESSDAKSESEETEGIDEPDEVQEPDYESMKKRELLALAAERSLAIPDPITKVELIDRLKS